MNKELKDLKEYATKDKPRHAFIFDYLHRDDSKITIYKANDQISGYLAFRKNYCVVNFSKNITEEDVKDAIEQILKNHHENKKFIDFTCDDITAKILKTHKKINKKVKYYPQKLAYATKKYKIENRYHFVHPKADEYIDYFHTQYLNFGRKTKEEIEKLVSKRNFTKEEIASTIVYRDQGQIVFTVSSSSVEAEVAVIIGVTTTPEYRGRGIATDGVAYMTNFLIEKGIIPVLFYTDPIAEKVYQKLGYKEVDYSYYMVDFK